jgi:hypothetical protein
MRSSQAGKDNGSSSMELRMSNGVLRKQRLKVGQRVTVTIRYKVAGSSKFRNLKVRVRASR